MPPVPPTPLPPALYPVDMYLYTLPPEPISYVPQTPSSSCIRRMRQLGVTESPRIYPKNEPAGTYGKEVKIQSNVFGVEIGKSTELFQYNVSITVNLGSLKRLVFTKMQDEDFVGSDRHEKCCSILSYAIEQYSNFFSTDDNVLLYDGQRMLYSKHDLFPNHDSASIYTKMFQIDGACVPNSDLREFPCIEFEIHSTRNPSVIFSQENVGKRSTDSNMQAIHPAHRNILELALNQSSVQESSKCIVFERGKICFIEPTEMGFQRRDMSYIDGGMQMMPGIKKTVQFIEGPCGRGQCNPSVVIDAMKVAFHKKQPVFEKLQKIPGTDFKNGLADLERERFAAVMEGLNCCSYYTGRARHHKIQGLHHEGAATTKFQQKDGRTFTVADYFKDRWNIALKFPNANLIVCKERGNFNFYPMELMNVTANQRVKTSQLTSTQREEATMESAVSPDDRQRLIMTGKEAAKITSDCDIMRKLGTSVCEAPLLVKARQLPPVKLAVNTTGTPIPIPQFDGTWKIGQYKRPAESPKNWALFAVGLSTSKITEAQLQRFLKEFIKMCACKGIQMGTPIEVGCVLVQDIETKLANAQKSGCKFVFCITDDSISDIHQKYKLVELLRSMVIQNMKMSNALSVVEQEKTLLLENVINKTNVKLGGTNYVFTDTKRYLNKVLVIGIGLSHAPPRPEISSQQRKYLNPMIIGFAHNGKDSQEFTGDFVLSQAGQVTLSQIEDIMTESIKGYKKWRGGEFPERVVVYRSGVREENHGDVIAYEIPLARFAMKKFSDKMKLIYVTVSKGHSYRFFPHDLSESAQSLEPSGRNIPPGISIDQIVTNPTIKQFFLNSHITLRGTAKTPLYSVLADDTRETMESLEDLTYSLCHLHQIVGLSTSLPTPLYVGNEYAKRGRNLWNEASRRDPQIRGEWGEEDQLREVGNSINYKNNSDFSDRRINA